MNLPFGLFHHRLVRVLAIGLPCLLAVALAVLQYGWIRQASVTEEQRRLDEESWRTESALQDVRRAVEASFEDLKLAVSLQRTAMGLGSGSEASIAEQALSAWAEQTRFKPLIRGVWLLADAPGGVRTVHVALGESGTTRTEGTAAALPAGLQPAAKLLGDRTAEARTAVESLRTQLGDAGFVLVWAALGSRSSLAALEIDTATYLKTVLPFHLRRGTAYAVTIHSASEQPVLTAPGRGLVFSVPNFWYASLFGEAPDAPQRPGAPWLSFPPEDSVGHLSVEFTEPAERGGIRAWLISNLAASVGLLALLLTALIGAFLLFVRMRELRAAEMEFVASIGHELRLPITVVRVIGDNLRAGIVRDQTRLVQYGEQIRRQTGRLSSMVESLLLSAGLQGEGAPECVDFDPSASVARVVEELAALLEEHGVKVDAEVVSTAVRGDADGFSLVLRNLLLNAVVHAAPGPEEPRLVKVRVAFQNGVLRLDVSDNGPGIPKKEQRAVFEAFARSARSLKEQHPGSGLGLHIAKRVVRLNGGLLTVSSPYAEEGTWRRGCRFTATMKGEASGG